jgi:serine phosphatase RsbU (regulator of sigma subunit)
VSHKVLFVDDDANLLAAFQRQLRKQFQIETALGGQEGLELVKNHGPFSVIVSDFRMPNMDGIEFLSRVRAMAPESVRIMLTGNADLEAAIKAVNEGNIFRFLTKPCSANLLGESLITGIEHYQQVIQEREYNEKTRYSLAQAMEVQQNLLPKTEPKMAGLDIAGKSNFCDETGGDYYDFINRRQQSNVKIGVVVGDVSDHGLPSALLMTSARAFLRERSCGPGGIASIVSDVNRQLTQDIEMSNRFMTLFYCEIDVKEKSIHWVRAGHDPAILYDPAGGCFEELKGRGLPLGVVENAEYRECQRELKAGQIIVIGTDGIWEAQNSAGRFFGKDRLRKIIQSHAADAAGTIVTAVMQEFEQYIYPLAQKDDATVVVIKVEP